MLFDPDTITDRATLESPRLRAAGIRLTFVNGVPVTRDGHYTGALPGRVLRRA